VGLVVAVPAAEGGGAGVGKQKGQRRRFQVAVSKDHVGYYWILFFWKVACSAAAIDTAFLRQSKLTATALIPSSFFSEFSVMDS